MDAIVLLIRNMVCQRCIMTVEELLQKQQLNFQKVILGEIHLLKELDESQKSLLSESLHALGFEIIDNQSGSIIEKIKQLVIRRARNEAGVAESRMKLSVQLSTTLHHEYTYLSSLFSAVEGRTIENYFIEQRIEKAKELLVYNELTISEIADELEYSGVAHLSTQFKKVTGLTPTYFKRLGALKRKALDQI